VSKHVTFLALPFFSVQRQHASRLKLVSPCCQYARNVSISFGWLYIDRVYRFHARQIGMYNPWQICSDECGPTIHRYRSSDFVASDYSGRVITHPGFVSLMHANNACRVQFIETDDSDAPRYLLQLCRFDGTPSTKWKFARTGTGK